MPNYEIIILNEIQNNGRTVHLYKCSQLGFYVAFGLSAFYVTHVIEPVLSFSVDTQMPVAIVRSQQLKLLRQLMTLKEQTDSEMRFETSTHIGYEGYSQWIKDISKHN